MQIRITIHNIHGVDDGTGKRWFDGEVADLPDDICAILIKRGQAMAYRAPRHRDEEFHVPGEEPPVEVMTPEHIMRQPVRQLHKDLDEPPLMVKRGPGRPRKYP